MNRYGVNVSSCRTSTTMSKKSVSPSGERTFYLHFFIEIIMAATVSLGRPYSRSICSILPLCIESNSLKKSTNKAITTRFFARTPFKFQLIVRIFDVMDQFLRKPF